MSFPKVTIQLVTYNSLKYLSNCLKSIFDSTYKDFQVLVIDNNSQDDSVAFIKNNYPEVTVFQNKKNLGFARANDQGIKLLNSPYVVFSNVDIILEPDWLEKIVSAADDPANSVYGCFGGKLLKLEIGGADFNEIEKTNLIDSCGLKIFKNHQVAELGAGQQSQDFSERQEVFGFSGALMLCRRLSLEQILLKGKGFEQGEYFDEDFFFYKEDVDLAWRLQLQGIKSFFLPEAVAYHHRYLKEAKNVGVRQIIEAKKSQSPLARYYSYRNQFFVLIKNEFGSNLIKYFPQIFFYEMKKFFFVLFFEWSSLSAIGQVFALMPKMLRKRKLIFKKVEIDSEEIRRWFQ